jgi:phenylpropionate dioxygenase-like ring-hydroxylating dioxygenase large terminal subunit
MKDPVVALFLVLWSSTAVFREADAFPIKAALNLSPQLAEYWYPVYFTSALEKKKDCIAPFELLGERWVLWKNAHTNKLSCFLDECPHRGVELSKGSVNHETGCLRCGYHGWEFQSDGRTTATPQLGKLRHNVSVATLPVRVHEGLVWVWPGSNAQARQGSEWKALQDITTLPKGNSYTCHAEVEFEAPIDHGLLIENVLDAAHLPFVHGSSFARKWKIPVHLQYESRRGLFPANDRAHGVQIGGSWSHYPMDMAFHPPCIVLSDTGVKKPGQIEKFDVKTSDCKHHFHQLQICLPVREGHVRFLYRIHTNFLGFTRFIPGINRRWKTRSEAVLYEDLELLMGQQLNMERHGNLVDFHAASEYDAPSIQYRNWRNSLVQQLLPK